MARRRTRKRNPSALAWGLLGLAGGTVFTATVGTLFVRNMFKTGAWKSETRGFLEPARRLRWGDLPRQVDLLRGQTVVIENERGAPPFSGVDVEPRDVSGPTTSIGMNADEVEIHIGAGVPVRLFRIIVGRQDGDIRELQVNVVT